MPELRMDPALHQLPLKVAAIMEGFKPNWFIAGGRAIDLYLGKVTRPHEDIEVAIFSRDQTALHDYLSGWRLQKVAHKEPSIWHRNELLELPVHELHCFKETAEPSRFEVLLNESNESGWVYRRNEKVTRPLARCYLTSKAGIKFLGPELVLLFKSKNPRAKDEQDFNAVVRRMEAERRRWLRSAVAACEADHPWLDRLGV